MVHVRQESPFDVFWDSIPSNTSAQRTFEVSAMSSQATMAIYSLPLSEAKIRAFPSVWKASEYPHWYSKSDVMDFCTGRVAFTPVSVTVQ